MAVPATSGARAMTAIASLERTPPIIGGKRPPEGGRFPSSFKTADGREPAFKHATSATNGVQILQSPYPGKASVRSAKQRFRPLAGAIRMAAAMECAGEQTRDRRDFDENRPRARAEITRMDLALPTRLG
jgi:hypothetical protein